MFSMTSNFLTPQNVLPLSSYLISQCSMRTTHQKVCSSRQINKVQELTAGNYFADIPSIDILNKSLHIKDGYAKFTAMRMRELILTGQIFNKSPVERQIQKYIALLKLGKTFQHQSHVSFNTFDENKREISAQNERTNLLLRKILIQPSKLLQNASSISGLGGVRYFRTERSETRRVRRDISDTQSEENHAEKPEATTPMQDSKNSLRALLSNESSPVSQTNLKIAFAEGYLSSEGKSKIEEPKSKLMKYFDRFRTFLSIIFFLILFTTALIMVLSSSPMGGSKFSIQFNGKDAVAPQEIDVSFDDVKGSDEAKQELEEIVDFLKNPEKYTSLGAELPCGVLLVGPPGTGKTLLARAVAGEAGVPFFHAAGSEFDEVLVGQGAKRVRKLFATAKKQAPCVVFIDEIDSVGSKRSSSVLHPYANQTINQLLSEMDGFHKADGVIVLGATNRRQDLDKALLRPGRFDVEVQVPIPDLKGRIEILNYYLEKVKLGQDIDVTMLSRGTTGFTGADLKNIVNQAALRAAADELQYVSMRHLEEGRDKVLMGPERKNRIPDREVNINTAFHESGHALVSYFTKDSTPLHKVTIIPRGGTLGHTAYIPSKEQHTLTKSQLLAALDGLMGGRAAEEVVFGPDSVTTGASNDLEKATEIAKSMVKIFGLSDKVGIRSFAEKGEPFMGGESVAMSDQTKELIDTEIKKLLQDSYERAKSLLKIHNSELRALVDALMRYETLDAADIKAILDGKPIEKDAH